MSGLSILVLCGVEPALFGLLAELNLVPWSMSDILVPPAVAEDWLCVATKIFRLFFDPAEDRLFDSFESLKLGNSGGALALLLAASPACADFLTPSTPSARWCAASATAAGFLLKPGILSKK